MQLLRLDHDAQWKLLSVRELREHERVLVESGESGNTYVWVGTMR